MAGLIEQNQVQAFELGVEALQVLLFAPLQQLCHEAGRREGTHRSSLQTGRKGQGGCQVFF